MTLLADLEDFVHDHRPHGALTADATEPAWNGYRLTVACPYGVVFGRWLTPLDATEVRTDAARIRSSCSTIRCSRTPAEPLAGSYWSSRPAVTRDQDPHRVVSQKCDVSMRTLTPPSCSSVTLVDAPMASREYCVRRPTRS